MVERLEQHQEKGSQVDKFKHKVWIIIKPVTGIGWAKSNKRKGKENL